MVSKTTMKSSKTTLTRTKSAKHKKRVNTYCANKGEKKCKKMKRTHKCRWVKDKNQDRSYCRKQSNITAATPFKGRKVVKRKTASVRRKVASVRRKVASVRRKTAKVRRKVASVRRKTAKVRRKPAKRKTASVRRKVAKRKSVKRKNPKKRKKVRFKKRKTTTYPWKLRKNGKTVFKFKTV